MECLEDVDHLVSGEAVEMSDERIEFSFENGLFLCRDGADGYADGGCPIGESIVASSETTSDLDDSISPIFAHHCMWNRQTIEYMEV
jgi:hypothetical protein